MMNVIHEATDCAGLGTRKRQSLDLDTDLAQGVEDRLDEGRLPRPVRALEHDQLARERRHGPGCQALTRHSCTFSVMCVDHADHVCSSCGFVQSCIIAAAWS